MTEKERGAASMSGQEYNGVTFEQLVQRLEALEHENATLRDEVAELRDSNIGQADEPAAELEGPVSTGLNVAVPRDPDTREILGEITCVSVDAITNGPIALRGHALQAEGVGVRGLGDTGVWGTSPRTGYSGVYGQHKGSAGYGIVGDGTGNGVGVLGRNQAGAGVRGEGGTGVQGKGGTGVQGEGGTGVWGKGSTTLGGTGVLGEGGTGVKGRATREASPSVLGDRGSNGPRGPGVMGVGVGDGAGNAGVSGRNWGEGGLGVFGDGGPRAAGVVGQNAFESGTGVVGVATDSVGGIGVSGNGRDYGGRFTGGKAQLKLVPANSAGKPTTGAHTKGEIYLDSAGALFVCTADGTPGTWMSVTTSAT